MMKHARSIVVAVAGGTVLTLGIALIVLPGPAFLVIPAGLAILAMEFAWARRWLRSARAILPRRSKNGLPAQRKFTLHSARTLPVEFDASRRAKLVLSKMGFIQRGSESAAVTHVLNAAAWTYVAAFISSLIIFLWHLLPLLTGGQRN